MKRQANPALPLRLWQRLVNRERRKHGWEPVDKRQLQERDTRLLAQNPRRRPGARVTGRLQDE